MEPVPERVSSVLKRRVVKPTEQRRREILEAALAAFGSKGFNETTVDEIAQAAGVAKGTVYLYFDSKEHLLLALKKDFMNGLTQSVADITAQAIEDFAAGKDVDYRDIIESSLDHFKKFTRSSRTSHIKPRYSGCLERCTGSISVSINQ